ncbi:hypothetical protein [Kitasatospora phosalacinea]|uniref:Uncharacterized protein n=1 Tax=Kitasatospora phosalacinea TaxID=2065 RepID=A0ABW6GRE7_9ACTN
MPKGKPQKGGPSTMLTFTQAAERLVVDEVVRSMGPEGLRKLARTDPEWPFAAEDYQQVAGARLLPYERLVEYFETRSKRKGRGPSRALRAEKGPATEPPSA